MKFLVKAPLILTALIVEIAAIKTTAEYSTEILGAQGAIIAVAIGVALFFCWYLLFNSDSGWMGKTFLAATAILLMSVTAYTVDTAKRAPELKQAQEKLKQAQEIADTEYNKTLSDYQSRIQFIRADYTKKESARFDALERVNAELKATSKKKQPEIFKQLVSQQAALMIATPEPKQPQKPVKRVVNFTVSAGQVDYTSMIQSALVGLIVPILLALASMVKTPPSHQHDTIVACDDEGEDEKIGDLLEQGIVPENAAGAVTIPAIKATYNCGTRKATTLRNQAVKSGILEQSGNRYIYAKPSTAQNVVSFVKSAAQ